MLYAFYEGFHTVNKILTLSEEEHRVIYKAMTILDLILLSFSIFITSIGIYELFVKPIDNLPKWIHVDDLDSLKAMLVKVIILVMGISFMGHVVTWDGDANLMGYGFAIASVMLALTYFLSFKIKD